MGVGTSVKRLDAIQKVTGSAKYVEDLIPLDALHMKVVHSSIANGLARMDFSISPEGDVSWYTGTFSTDEKIAGREDLCGEHYAVPAVHACHLENNTCFAYMDGRRMVVYSCNQVPHTLRLNIAEAIGMPLGDVRVVKPFFGRWLWQQAGCAL